MTKPFNPDNDTFGGKPVLHSLADIYSAKKAAKTGTAASESVPFDYEGLLRISGCGEGELRVCAERDIAEAHRRGLLVLERHPLGNPTIIRFHHSNADRLFAELGRVSPNSRRNDYRQIFEDAARLDAPEAWRDAWTAFCHRLSDAASVGASTVPFHIDSSQQARDILPILPSLLSWEGECLRRFASCKLFGTSKVLERSQGMIEKCLNLITDGQISSLEDLGIFENERDVSIHGPLTLRFDDAGTIDVGHLKSLARISRTDIRRASLETSATQCLTVENLSVLHELAKRQDGTLLASSGRDGGFAHCASIEFLQSLPEHVEIWHCGDSDPAGFEILTDLRRRTGLHIRSLGMTFDASVDGDPLDANDRKTIQRVLDSPFATDEEKGELRQMQEAGCLGRFEQESRPLPILTQMIGSTVPVKL